MSPQSMTLAAAPRRAPADARATDGRVQPPAQPSRAAIFCFSVLAEADPGVMPRVLELFAKRGLVPVRWVSDVTDARRGELAIDVQVAGLTRATGDHIAACLRGIPGVETVLTSQKGG